MPNVLKACEPTRNVASANESSQMGSEETYGSHDFVIDDGNDLRSGNSGLLKIIQRTLHTWTLLPESRQLQSTLQRSLTYGEMKYGIPERFAISMLRRREMSVETMIHDAAQMPTVSNELNIMHS